MKLNEKQIKEIADELECGMICFYHKPTGTIASHPDVDELYNDPEPWEDIIEKIEDDWGNYVRFEKMESRESYKVMEDFAYSLPDEYFKNKVLKAISGRKPFQQFKNLIDSSDYRQVWFDFKSKAYIDFVKLQMGTMEK